MYSPYLDSWKETVTLVAYSLPIIIYWIDAVQITLEQKYLF